MSFNFKTIKLESQELDASGSAKISKIISDNDEGITMSHTFS
jgi:hypothetical protein